MGSKALSDKASNLLSDWLHSSHIGLLDVLQIALANSLIWALVLVCVLRKLLLRFGLTPSSPSSLWGNITFSMKPTLTNLFKTATHNTSPHTPDALCSALFSLLSHPRYYILYLLHLLLPRQTVRPMKIESFLCFYHWYTKT